MPSGRPTIPDRQLAIGLGDMTYDGSRHARCGTTERYVNGGGCVHCVRVLRRETRQLKKYQRMQEAIEREARADAELEEIEVVAPNYPIRCAENDPGSVAYIPDLTPEQRKNIEIALDIPQDMALEPEEDAKARVEKAIDELM